MVTMITSQAPSTGTNSMGSRCVHYINGHLPSSLQEDRRWMKLVLPTLVTRARSLGDPWVILDQDSMQLSSSVFGAAILALPPSPSWLISSLQALMTHTAPMFEKLVDPDPSKSENAYQLQFLLQLLMHTHLWPYIGCPDVLRLDTNALKEHSVKGAISLSCAALKCMIHLFQRGDLHVNDQLSSHGKATARTPLKLNKLSGRETSTTLSFSKQNWGACTHQYFMSVNKHNSAVLKEVIASASAFVTPTMDSLMAEDGTSPDDVLTDGFLTSEVQLNKYKKYENDFDQFTDDGQECHMSHGGPVPDIKANELI
ncbi:hypothetical protein EDD17DRAFT_1515405 [Pisolithus thermaeus]|nr:hypothetical protein EV401DRAFT_1890068 [Pisolithus croceorrhizus]KAI6143876.1 hypothetical protein EDD17DRAFT_1515405 [Pisolithus thermaeus]